MVATTQKVDQIYNDVQAMYKTTLEKFDAVNKALSVEIYSAVKKAIK